MSLVKTLAEYFPELAGRIENADQITLRMILQHRSGIPNYVDHPDYLKNSPNSGKDELEFAINLPADFEPDEYYVYSNTNYLLLSRIIEKVAVHNSFQYYKEEILTPLGLVS